MRAQSKTLVGEMSFYINIRSSQDVDFFPNNKPYCFNCKLRQAIIFNGRWEMGLTELTLNESSVTEKTLVIYSDICGESLISGVYAPVLRKVHLTKQENYIFNFPYYLPVVKSEINELEILVKNDHELPAVGLKQPISLVIHFKETQA